MPATTVPDTKPNELFTKRLRLRAPKLEDAFAINAIYNESRQVAQWVSAPYPCPMAHTLERFNRFLTFPAHERCYILEKKGKRVPIGMVLANWARAGEPPIIGFFLDAPNRGKGLMREAVAAAIAEVFRLTGADTLRAATYADNPASEKVLTKLGFAPAGSSESYNQASRAAEAQTEWLLQRTDFTG